MQQALGTLCTFILFLNSSPSTLCCDFFFFLRQILKLKSIPQFHSSQPSDRSTQILFQDFTCSFHEGTEKLILTKVCGDHPGSLSLLTSSEHDISYDSPTCLSPLPSVQTSFLVKRWEETRGYHGGCGCAPTVLSVPLQIF